MSNKKLNDLLNNVPLNKGHKVARQYLNNLLTKCRFPWHKEVRQKIQREIEFVDTYLI